MGLATLVQGHAVVGVLRHYRPTLLRTCFRMFSTPTMRGLATLEGARIDILAMDAKVVGVGDGGRFLRECMAAYDTVAIWEIHNDLLAGMLSRRGFREVRERVDGEWSDGMRWDR